MGFTYFLIIVYILFLFMEISIISLKMTGLPLEKARFQVISLFTSTGFTTKESELITQHPIRRKIAERIMIIKYIGGIVGAATLFSAYANALSRKVDIIDVFICIIMTTLILTVIKNKWILGKIDYFVESQLISQAEKNKRKLNADSLWVRDDFGIVDVVLTSDNYLVGTRLKDTNLKANLIQILNIDKGDKYYPFPKPDYKLEAGDKLTIYGNLKNIKLLITNELEDTEEQAAAAN